MKKNKCDHTIGYQAQYDDWFRVRVSDIKELKQDDVYPYKKGETFSTSDDFVFCPDCGEKLKEKHFI